MTANPTVTLPVVSEMGITALTVAPARLKACAGPRRLVTKVVTRRWWFMNQRNRWAVARARKAHESTAAEAPGAAVLRTPVRPAICTMRCTGLRPNGIATGITPVWLPRGDGV